MSKARFSKLAALCAVLAMVLASGAILPKARALPLTEADLKSELQTLDSFGDDLSKFDRRRIQLGKKASLTNEEFNALKGDADALKRRLSQVQSAIRSIISKLKASGQWDDLDNLVLSKTNDEKFKSFLRENGGAKRLFEEAATQIGSQPDEVIVPVENLRTKVARMEAQDFSYRVIAASYNPEAPLLKRSAGCILATIHYAAGIVTHPFTSPSQLKGQPGYSCKCHDVCGDEAT